MQTQQPEIPIRIGNSEPAISHARRVAERLPTELPYIGAPPAPSTVSGLTYTVSYYEDHSILICARNHPPIVLDEERTYYRDSVEFLARCLGSFSRDSRAEMIQGYAARQSHESGPIWIGGVCWNLDGTYVAV